MPIELEAAELIDAGQQAYEALLTVFETAQEEPALLVGLLGALQRGDPWERLPPLQRELCAELEDELFDDGEKS